MDSYLMHRVLGVLSRRALARPFSEPFGSKSLKSRHFRRCKSSPVQQACQSRKPEIQTFPEMQRLVRPARVSVWEAWNPDISRHAASGSFVPSDRRLAFAHEEGQRCQKGAAGRVPFLPAKPGLRVADDTRFRAGLQAIVGGTWAASSSSPRRSRRNSARAGNER